MKRSHAAHVRTRTSPARSVPGRRGRDGAHDFHIQIAPEGAEEEEKEKGEGVVHAQRGKRRWRAFIRERVRGSKCFKALRPSRTRRAKLTLCRAAVKYGIHVYVLTGCSVARFRARRRAWKCSYD